MEPLGQKPERGGLNGKLAGTGEEEPAFEPHYVAHVAFLEEREYLVADYVLFYIRLKASAPVLHLYARRLAEIAYGHHTPRDTDDCWLRLKLVLREVAVLPCGLG